MAKKEAEKKQDEVQEVKQAEPVFTKAQILAAKKNHDRRDALGAVLDDNFEGTLAEADDLLEKFMKGQVK